MRSRKLLPGLACLLLVSFTLFLSGCASTRLTQQLLTTPTEHLPRHHEIRDVPFYPQELYQCGPASLAEVLNYRGKTVTPDQLKPEIYLPERQGSLQLEMVAVVRSRGMLAYRLAPSLRDLVQEIAANNPVLVLQNLSIRWHPLWHYAVVVGYDLDREEVILRSGTTQRLAMPLQTFERTWSRSDHWALVVMPPGQLPVTAEQVSYLKAAQELESLGQLIAAQQSYSAALERWPDNSIAWMGAGNTAYSLKQFDQAEQAFRELLVREPRSAPAWNNLAYTLLAQGCAALAIEAAQCAVKLSPDDENVLGTLIEITKQAGQQKGKGACRPILCPLP